MNRILTKILKEIGKLLGFTKNKVNSPKVAKSY